MKAAPSTLAKFFSLATVALFAMALTSNSLLAKNHASHLGINSPAIIPGSTNPGTGISTGTSAASTSVHVGTQQPNAPTRYAIGTVDNPVTVSEYVTFLRFAYVLGGSSGLGSQTVPTYQEEEACNVAYDSDLMDSTSSDYCIDSSCSFITGDSHPGQLFGGGSYTLTEYTYTYSYAIANDASSHASASASVPTADWIIDAVASQEVANAFAQWRQAQPSAN